MIENVEKIIWPKLAKSASSWNHYIFNGFRKLGIKTERSDEHGLRPGVKGNFPIDIYWKSGICQKIWYDYADFATHYYEKAVRGNDLYFKIMLRKDDPYADRIYPIGQTTAGADEDLLNSIRISQENLGILYDVIGIFRYTDHGIRANAVRIVSSNPWKSLVGMCGFRPNRPAIPPGLHRRKLGWKEHLQLQCRSKICLDFPGVGGDWAWRFTEILGMARFCLRTEPTYACPGNPKNCWAEVKRDLSDLKEKIEFYLANDVAREEIAQNGKKYYDSFLSPKAQAAYILKIAAENLE